MSYISNLQTNIYDSLNLTGKHKGVSVKEAAELRKTANAGLSILNSPLDKWTCKEASGSMTCYQANTPQADIFVTSTISAGTAIHTRDIRLNWKDPKIKKMELSLAAYCQPELRIGNQLVPYKKFMTKQLGLWKAVVDKFSQGDYPSDRDKKQDKLTDEVESPESGDSSPQPGIKLKRVA